MLSPLNRIVQIKSLLADCPPKITIIAAIERKPDAIICRVHRKSHAVTLSTPLGAELLIHVGVDTVELNGTGFTPLVVAGQKVRQGERILKFDLQASKNLCSSSHHRAAHRRWCPGFLRTLGSNL